MTASTVVSAWETFRSATGGITRPVTEADYVALLELIDDLTSRYNGNTEPYSSLFDIIATYIHEWELVNEPDLKNLQVAPYQTLAQLMQERGVSHYRLANRRRRESGDAQRRPEGQVGYYQGSCQKARGVL